ncbi:hypothetical protein Bca52824_019552 [Brassica carinata]|uniref:Uncharacterized protein n=1 Tax=Brassica carinata TaxID=52824 RepID=A0A8X7VSB8_BRACI|nr:hypothetical protein Bca52824_019552 [Brassica carinata]
MVELRQQLQESNLYITEIVVATGKTAEQEAMVIEQEAIQTEIAELAEKSAEVEVKTTLTLGCHVMPYGIPELRD